MTHHFDLQGTPMNLESLENCTTEYHTTDNQNKEEDCQNE